MNEIFYVHARPSLIFMTAILDFNENANVNTKNVIYAL